MRSSIMKNWTKLMKEAQKMQEKLKQQMEELKVEASAGGDMVTATMDGNKQLISLKIDPEVVNPQDIDMLQDLIIAAINEAARKVDEELKGEMGSLLGGFNIPNLT
jgi:DNA-binding YbaB/EbfC family protein